MTAEMEAKRDEGALTWSSRFAGVEVVHHEGGAAGHLVVRRGGVGHMGGGGERRLAEPQVHKAGVPGKEVNLHRYVSQPWVTSNRRRHLHH